MKHGLKFRKLSRTKSHRYALLRNLVSALLHHEMIKTTVPKAKEAARMAEKIITYGKRNSDPARRQAQAFLYPAHHYTPEAFTGPVPPTPPPNSRATVAELADPEAFTPPASLLRKLFTDLAERYQDRPGGYTRIQKFGRRPGDYAEVAIVSLVDGPRDVKFEMAARAVARETVVAGKGLERGADDLPEDASALRPRTARARERTLKFRGEKGQEEFKEKVQEYSHQLAAELEAIGHHRPAEPSKYEFQKPSKMVPKVGRRVRAGERLPGMSTHHSGLGLARGALARHTLAESRKPLFATEAPVQPSRADVD